MKDMDLSESVKEWQKVLRLQDWDIEGQWKHHSEIGDLMVGTVHINHNRKCAQVWLIYPGEQSPTGIPMEYDPEITLVHELLHIHFHPFEPKSWDNHKGIAQEQAIDALSRSLVGLKRQSFKVE